MMSGKAVYGVNAVTHIMSRKAVYEVNAVTHMMSRKAVYGVNAVTHMMSGKAVYGVNAVTHMMYGKAVYGVNAVTHMMSVMAVYGVNAVTHMMSGKAVYGVNAVTHMMSRKAVYGVNAVTHMMSGKAVYGVNAVTHMMSGKAVYGVNAVTHMMSGKAVYGVNAVTHMMSGKAVSRAIRGHLLVESPLMTRLTEAVLPRKSDQGDDDDTIMEQQSATVEPDDEDRTGSVFEDVYVSDDPDSECHDELDVILNDVDNNLLESTTRLNQIELEQLRSSCELLRNLEIDVETACDSPALLKLENILEDIKCEQKKRSRTAQLWLTYMDYIDTLKLFIRAERLGNWNMHVIAVGCLLLPVTSIMPKVLACISN